MQIFWKHMNLINHFFSQTFVIASNKTFCVINTYWISYKYVYVPTAVNIDVAVCALRDASLGNTAISSESPFIIDGTYKYYMVNWDPTSTSTRLGRCRNFGWNSTVNVAIKIGSARCKLYAISVTVCTKQNTR